MWPSVPSFGSFATVACPAGAKCELPYCIFSHSAANKPVDPTTDPQSLETGRERKRVKLGDDGTKKLVVQANNLRARTPQSVFVGSIATKQASSPENKDTSKGKIAPENTSVTASAAKNGLPRSATRPVSPPQKSTEAKPTPKPETPVSLTPRKLAKEPAIFTKRLILLQTLHKFMTSLNDKVANSSDANVNALALTENQLNKMAVDEEENIGIHHKAVYENVLKQRMVVLKKMSLETWVKERNGAIAKENGEEPAPAPPKSVETGLSGKEEVILLFEMISPQAGLDDHGYVIKLPTEGELDETRKTLAIVDHWEVCDRCNTRFQVFPDRREEDGALTTGGQCKHHWGKKIYPRKVKGQPLEQTRYTCCNEVLGSPGCSVHDTHVFKVSEARRLSVIMPFIETPENDQAAPHTAVCFDCEMGYTTSGLELMRLTAVSWPSHKAILDVLVRPIGHILDLNTRFSGIAPEQYFNASPHDPNNPVFDPKDLRIVESPHIARDLFLAHISPRTPLIGHALENDLNSIRLIHPTFVDTVFLFPHRAGLPIRNRLRVLAKTHLNLDIQQAGAAGHDSFEDARATGELVRFKIAERWRQLKRDGWAIRDDALFPPVPTTISPMAIPPPPPPLMDVLSVESLTGEKRKHDEFEQD